MLINFIPNCTRNHVITYTNDNIFTFLLMRTTIEKCSLKKSVNYLSFKRLYSEANKKAQLSILKKHIDYFMENECIYMHMILIHNRSITHITFWHTSINKWITMVSRIFQMTIRYWGFCFFFCVCVWYLVEKWGDEKCKNGLNFLMKCNFVPALK